MNYREDYGNRKTTWIDAGLHRVVKIEASKRGKKMQEMLDYFLRKGLESEARKEEACAAG